MASPLLLSGQRYESHAVVNVTANGSANTKGNYSDLIASTAHPAKWLLVTARPNSNDDFLVDIAIGAAASEQVIIANIPAGMETGSFLIGHFLIPVGVPAGTRLAARCQSTTGSQTIEMSVMSIESGALIPGMAGRVTTYGANTADSGGTSVDPGGVANTKGSYSEISSSTTAPVRWLVICFGNQNNSARTDADWRIDVAIGAAGSEQVIIPNLRMTSNDLHDTLAPFYYSFPCSIPSGTRLAVRAQSTITDGTDRLFDVILLGVD